MTLTICRICCPAEPNSDHEQNIISQLQKILPQEFHHEICSHKALDGDNFKCMLRLKLLTEGEANDWLRAFQASSFMTWRVKKTYPDTGRYNKYRVDFRCQHNAPPKGGKAPKKPGKDTQCPAMMYLVVKRATARGNRPTRSRDPHIHLGMCFNVSLRNEHNHALLEAEFRQKRDVSQETSDTLMEFFRRGHTPTSALSMLKGNLREEFGENYDHVVADRAVCPDLQFCYRLYYNMTKQANGTNIKKVLRKLEKRLALYNQEHKDICATIKRIDNNATVVAVCTPFMKRVHANIEGGAHVVFVDSSASADRHPCYLYVLLAHTPVGGLPLGVLISTSETESTITAGFELLRSLFPEGAFDGQGADGPRVVLPRDCLPLRQSAHAAYPNAELTLSVKHILQASWMWLWDDSNGIPSPDRPILLHIVETLVHADSSVHLEEKYRSALETDIVQKYTAFQDHLAKIYQARETWSVHCQDQPQAPSGDRSEEAMRIFKDKILYRMKAYDIRQLVDFVLKQMDACYERRLREVTKKGMKALLNSKYFLQGRDINHAEILQVSKSQFTVPSLSSGQEHLVDMELGMCTCPVGIKGGPCKHQQAIVRKFKLPNFDLSPTLSPQLKKVLSNIVTEDGVESSTTSMQQPESAQNQELTIALESVAMTVAKELLVTSTELQKQAQAPAPAPAPAPTEMSQSCAEPTHDTLRVLQHKETMLPLEQRLSGVFHTIGEKLRTDPEAYKTAVRSFVTSFEKLPSDSAIVSALYTFGRSPGEVSAAKRLKVAARKSLLKASQFGVRPNANKKLSE